MIKYYKKAINLKTFQTFNKALQSCHFEIDVYCGCFGKVQN